MIIKINRGRPEGAQSHLLARSLRLPGSQEGKAVGWELAMLCAPAGALAVGALQLSWGVQGGWPQWGTSREWGAAI